jgi:AraC-like DNA-binding protein/CheY-like chemotaxis protein
MMNGKATQDVRFALVSAAHRFLLDVLPFRHPDSSAALDAFVAEASRYRVSPDLIDALLIRCLVVLDRNAGNPLPSLVDAYVSQHTERDPWRRFSKCVTDVLKYGGVSDILVQQAIALIEEHYSDPTLTIGKIAAHVGRRPAALSMAFKRSTDMTVSEYLRRIRLEHAGRLLTLTTQSIKEVWSNVGYKHGSNFGHDFKDQFGMSPSDHRARAILRDLDDRANGAPVGSASRVAERVPPQRDPSVAVLIVDRDELHATISTRLQSEGYSTFTATTGADALDEIERVSPDVVLLEYQLPDMSGVECLRALRQRHSTKPAVGLFTADWNAYDEVDEIHSLNGTLYSKLCGLDEVEMLITGLLRQQNQQNDALANTETLHDTHHSPILESSGTTRDANTTHGLIATASWMTTSMRLSRA